MANSFVVTRAQLVYALCLPLAVLVGYLLAEPSDLGSVLLVMAVLGLLSIPLFMRWYHMILLSAWNAVIVPYFLPGQPQIWILLAFVGFGFAVANRFSNPDATFISVPPIRRPLLFLAGVILITAFLRGGIRLQSMGSAQAGGKYYVYSLAAIVGYFALISLRIPKNRANLAVGLFFLSGLTAIVPNLAYLAGSRFNFLYYVFPPGWAMEQAMGEYATGTSITRIYGLTVSSFVLLGWLMARYGIRGTFDWNKPWRFALLLVAFGCAAFSGFRLIFLICFLTFAFQFWFEGLWRPRNLAIIGGVALVLAAVLLPNMDRLPLVVQRTLSFLPGKINPIAKVSAEASAEWRFQMWTEALPEIPKYLLEGKGYAMDLSEVLLSSLGTHRLSGYQGALESGDYHNGPLTLIITFGIWGVFGFGWMVVAGFKYLYRNYRFGDPDLQPINTLILAYFAARTVVFLILYGNFATDLYIFTGLLGLSVSLNGATLPEPATETVESEEPSHHERFAAVEDQG